jgi:hypothetical protein
MRKKCLAGVLVARSRALFLLITGVGQFLNTRDMTTDDDAYFERGISRLHGFLSEY